MLDGSTRQVRFSRTVGLPLLFTAFLLGAVSCRPGPGSYRVDVLVPGSEFHGVHGLTFDAEDRLYAGSVVGQTIYGVDPQTGQVDVVVPPPEGMADDLEFGPDGQLVWTSFLLGVIHSRRGDGPIEVLATGLPGINSLAFNGDGRLFATQVFLGDALYEIDPRGEDEPRQILAEMGGLNGFDFGPDGGLYGPLWFKGEVARVDVDRGELTTVASGFQIPAAANFDSQGNLWVLDTAAGHVVHVDVATGEKRTVAQVPTGLDNLALDSQDRLFVSNFADNSIYEIKTSSGEARQVVEGELALPGGLALFDDGERETLYVADTFAYRSIDPQSGEVTDLARMMADEIDYPSVVSVNDRHVVLASWFSGAVQKLDRKTGQSLEMVHGFNAPGAVLALPDGRILVAELGSGDLLLLGHKSGEGEPERHAVAQGLNQPAGLAAAATDTVYVAEAGSGSVLAVDLASGEKTVVVSGLEMPEGLAVTPGGEILVAEVGKKRLLRVDPGSGTQTVVATDLPLGLVAPAGLPAPFVPTGLAVSKTGTVYLSSDEKNAVYKLQPE